METTALRAAYDTLLEVATAPNFGAAAEGGWDADQVLAHLISVDAGIASTALAIVAGSRPTTARPWTASTSAESSPNAPIAPRCSVTWADRAACCATSPINSLTRTPLFSCQ